MEENKIELKSIKIGLLGDSTVGKTAICRSLLNQPFMQENIATIGSDKLDSKFTLKNGKTIKLCLFDSAGQERFRSIAFTTLKAVHGIIIVFDITYKRSFENVTMWLNLIKEKFEDPSLVIFGNKIDLDESKWEISEEEIKKLCEENNLEYFATSAKIKKGIIEGFDYIVNTAYDNALKKNKNNDNIILDKKNINNNNNDNKKKCCGGKK